MTFALIACTTCAPYDAPLTGAELLGELRREFARSRAVRARLSISAGDAPCARPADSDDCPSAPSSELSVAYAAKAARVVRTEGSSAAFHAAGLVDLLLGHARGNAIDQSIKSLRHATWLDTTNIDAWADLSAALIERGMRLRRLRDVMEGAEAAATALEIDSLHGTSLFNLSLAAGALALESQTSRVVSRLALSDSSSPWTREARSIALRLFGPGERRTSAAWAVNDGQQLRELGWDGALADWGRAALRKDSGAASVNLRVADSLAGILGRSGGDLTLHDAAATIRRAPDDTGLQVAIVRLAEGRRAFLRGDYRSADSLLGLPAEATKLQPLRDWARLFRGAARYYRRDVTGALLAFRAVAASADTIRHPALAARAAWSIGSLMTREGRYEETALWYERAARWYRRAGEGGNLGIVLSLQAESEFSVGNDDRGASLLQEAIDRCRKPLARW